MWTFSKKALQNDLSALIQRIDDLFLDWFWRNFSKHFCVQTHLLFIALCQNSKICHMICLKIDQYKSILFLKQKVSDTLYRDKVRPDV